MAVSAAKPKGVKATIQSRGRTITRYGENTDCITVWNEGEDAVFCNDAEELEKVLGNSKASSPARPRPTPPAPRLAKKANRFEPVAFAFIDITQLPSMPPDAGSDGVRSAQARGVQFGIPGKRPGDVGLEVRHVPTPRKGLLAALVDQPTFDPQIRCRRCPRRSPASQSSRRTWARLTIRCSLSTKGQRSGERLDRRSRRTWQTSRPRLPFRHSAPGPAGTPGPSSCPLSRRRARSRREPDDGHERADDHRSG